MRDKHPPPPTKYPHWAVGVGGDSLTVFIVILAFPRRFIAVIRTAEQHLPENVTRW